LRDLRLGAGLPVIWVTLLTMYSTLPRVPPRWRRDPHSVRRL